jgi:hypothetical protein
VRNNGDDPLVGDAILSASEPRPLSIETMQRLTIPGSNDGVLRIPGRGTGYVRVAYEDWLGPDRDVRRWHISFADSKAYSEVREKETYKLTVTARFGDQQASTVCCLGPDLVMGDALELWHGEDCAAARERDREAVEEDARRLAAGARPKPDQT